MKQKYSHNFQLGVMLVIAIVVAFAITMIYFIPRSMGANTLTPKSSFTFNGVTYKFTSVALNLSEQEKGLMNATVTNSTFELFAFPVASIYPFWMMNTYYPLDIIWVNNNTVTYIANATPCSWYSHNQTSCIIYNSYNGGHNANYVIEAQSGFVNRTGMKVGSVVSIN